MLDTFYITRTVCTYRRLPAYNVTTQSLPHLIISV